VGGKKKTAGKVAVLRVFYELTRVDSELIEDCRIS
jgi:hypothetical protein